MLTVKKKAMRRERTNIVSWVFIGDDKYIENGTNSIAIHIDTYINIIHLMIGKKRQRENIPVQD